LLDRRAGTDIGLALLAMRPADPGRYGRVVANGGLVERIIEWAEADSVEREIALCNAGVLCTNATSMRRWLAEVRNDNEKGEYYLTDLVALARAEGEHVAAVEAPEAELRGINSRVELAAAEATVQTWLRDAAMEAGVTMTAPDSVFLCADTRFEQDVCIGPDVVFGPGVTVRTGAVIKSFCQIEGAEIGRGAIIGPFARLRPGTRIGADAHIGNFVELKATEFGAGAKASHLSYLGDSAIGAGTNIGAGTITCNYDGYDKHRTTIGANVFIGSDSVLVAPVTIGDGAFVTAGSVITRDVAPDAMAFGRAQQIDKPSRAAEFHARHRKQKG
jgi:bifunctional UDP-N-acetylglucosamine pyrophosphorylase/glucosamine-1-phosphate N-acetyltransferase